jgi:Right handed beta helix region
MVFAAALALAATLPAVPAQAQATRAFVSAAGSDNNNCINTNTPCRHFQNAYNAMPNGGEIDVLDPGNYGALTVNHPLNIVGRGWATVGAVSGAASITINAGPSDKINITGVLLDGANIATTTGILFNAGGALTVRDSVIRNFTLNGIKFSPNSASQISVANSQISDNGEDGIQVLANLIFVRGLFSHADLENNTNVGLDIRSSAAGGRAYVTISDCVSATNGTGISAAVTVSGGLTFVMVRNSTIANNDNSGLDVVTNGTMVVTRSTITGNTPAWTTSGGGLLLSYGDNNFVNDFGNDVEPSNPLPYD